MGKGAASGGVRVVLFANEENGFHGAKAYAARDKIDLHNHYVAVESDWGAGRIYALRKLDHKSELVTKVSRTLEDLGIVRDEVAGVPGPDIGFLAKQGVPWVQLAQDASQLFDNHHSDNDTLDKITPSDLKQNVAAYAVFSWLMGN